MEIQSKSLKNLNSLQARRRVTTTMPVQETISHCNLRRLWLNWDDQRIDNARLLAIGGYMVRSIINDIIFIDQPIIQDFRIYENENDAIGIYYLFNLAILFITNYLREKLFKL